MKKYIIIHEDDITKQINRDLKSLNIGDELTSIKKDDGADTGYKVIKFYNENVPDSLSRFKRLDNEKTRGMISDILNGISIENLKKTEVVRNSAFKSPDGKRARFKGVFNVDPSENSNTYEWTVDAEYFITGGVVKCWNCNPGDSISFEVLAGGVVVDKFLSDWYVSDEQLTLDAYPAKLLPGLKIRLTYNKTGVNTPKFVMNLMLHEI